MGGPRYGHAVIVIQRDFLDLCQRRVALEDKMHKFWVFCALKSFCPPYKSFCPLDLCQRVLLLQKILFNKSIL